MSLLKASRMLAAMLALAPASLMANEEPPANAVGTSPAPVPIDIYGVQYPGGAAPGYGYGYGGEYCDTDDVDIDGHHTWGHRLSAAHAGYPTPFHVWARHDGASTFSPDHGYRRITRLPIVQFPVQYYEYWPDRWYGMPNSELPYNPNYPMVYMPTDTTQLGYYYQRVPTWQPNIGMLPAPPYPPQWHRYEGLAYGPDGVASGYYDANGVYCPPGAVTTSTGGTSPTLADPDSPAPEPDPGVANAAPGAEGYDADAGGN